MKANPKVNNHGNFQKYWASNSAVIRIRNHRKIKFSYENEIMIRGCEIRLHNLRIASHFCKTVNPNYHFFRELQINFF